MKKKENKFGGPGKIALVNSITALRFIGAFLVLPIFKACGGVIAAIYSAIFMFSDCIDGFLARKLKVSTFFGSIFDGATDKAFMIMAFGLLMTFNPVVFSIPLLMELGILIVQKNKMKKGLNVKSNFIGKAKTWVLSASMVASLAAAEFLNLKPIFEYLKTASLSKVADIKDILVLLGINLPGIVLQLLTFNSYNNELKEAKEEEQNLNLVDLETLTEQEKADMMEKLNDEDKALMQEYYNCDKKNESKDVILNVESPENILNDIALRKAELKEEYTALEKAKILGSALFDPVYYDKNKDQQIRVLTKELFTKKK